MSDFYRNNKKIVSRFLLLNSIILVSIIWSLNVYAYEPPQVCGGGICHDLADESLWVILGDSITEAHYYSDYLETYYHLRYPNMNIHFRGEGRGGSQFDEVINQDRYGRRVYSWNPDLVSVMFGHNEGDTADVYESNYNNLISNYIIAKNSANPILLGPHPMYDSNGKVKLGEFADKVVAVGGIGDYAYSELWHYLQPIFSSNFSAQDPIDLGYVGADKTHPGASGHLAIVYGLLSQMNADGNVSAVNIDANDLTYTAIDATVTNLIGDASGVTFDRLDARMPMAWDDDAVNGTELIPEIWDMNKYMLTISGLPSGEYDVYVDDILSASIDSTELATGWNMTKMTTGPIHEQLQEVLGRVRDKEGINRVSLEGESPWSGVRKYQSNADYAYNTLGYRNDELAAYLVDVIDEVAALDLLIYQAATPVIHQFRIVRSNSVRADVDQNLQINTIDALLTLRKSSNLNMDGTNWQISEGVGDVNCDGNSDFTDAALILRRSLNLSVDATGWCDNGYTLTVIDPGNGDAIACSDTDLSAIINCGNGMTACSAIVSANAEITGMTAIAAADRNFTAWTGEIVSSENPTSSALVMNGDKTVAAVFENEHVAGCESMGMWGLIYDLDHLNGTTTACVQGSTVAAIFTEMTADASVNATPSGTYGLLWDGTCNKYANIPATTITPENGRIEFKIITPAVLPENRFGAFEWGGSGASIVGQFQYNATYGYRFSAAHHDGSTLSVDTAYTNLTPSTAYDVAMDWNQITGVLQVEFAGLSDDGNGSIDAFAMPVNGVRFGEDWTNNCFGGQPIGFDDIKMGESLQ